MEPALQEAPLPKYIAIEGPIGVGKTTLAHKIAETFNYDVFLEQPAENPFLKSFYRNPKQSALATQLFFLFQRMQQIEDLKQRSLFEPVRVADFLIQKDRLFAEVTLSGTVSINSGSIIAALGNRSRWKRVIFSLFFVSLTTAA